MPFADFIALRGAAAILLLFLAAALLRDGWRVAAARYGAALALSGACSVVTATPEFCAPGSLWLIPFQIGAFGGEALLWLFAAALFDDEFEESWRYGAIWAAMVAMPFVARSLHSSAMAWIHAGFVFGFAGLAFWLALSGRSGDLVEGRRRFRIVFVAAIGSYIATVNLLDLGFDAAAPITIRLVQNAVLLAIALGAGWSVLIVNRDGPLLSLAPSARRRVAAAAPAASPALGDSEGVLLDALRDIMERQRAYREEGLTITALAARLGTQEYRLRRLINQKLDHRNFSEFLNRYRLSEITAALGDPAQAEVSILTIALDAGFGSIGPFNRAFKAHTGQTPTEYRRAQLADSGIGQHSSERGQRDSETSERARTTPSRVLPQRAESRPPI